VSSGELREVEVHGSMPRLVPRREGDTLNLGEWLWAMVAFFFWFMAIWIFIQIFADIFHRRDLSGAAKAGWIILLIVLPFLGALIYMIARPKMTEQDREDIQRMQEAQRRLTGYSPAAELEKLAKLRDAGEISAEEYTRLKERALVEI
jgi:Short C-terminal domain/Phospholipase_D-nuclease N-terminal